MVQSFPPGVRFVPSDYEVIHYYLELKIMNGILPYNHIQEVNLYKYSPEELSGMYPRPQGENELYVFTPRDRKYRNGTRPKRAAGNGYWKATGADKPITHGAHCVIGYKKTLVYYEGKPPNGEKTNWIMHEYTVKDAKTPKPRRDNADPMRLDDWVLCRIYNKTDKGAGCTQKEDENNVEANTSPPPPPPHDEESVEVQEVKFDEESVEVQEVKFSFPPKEMTFHNAFEFGNDPIYDDAQFINSDSDSFIPEIIYNQPLDFHIDHILSSQNVESPTLKAPVTRDKTSGRI
ncbi:NAC transcription factor 32-like [Ipomoea triloba]|uniref:NAC transcription factor 32-like n=1 Tax=Ipomoea triloba TaxID=35885 RepID=UPI00125E39F5|nr:NAC transcription factor 32-like [Ipomoea triloba]